MSGSGRSGARVTGWSDLDGAVDALVRGARCDEIDAVVSRWRAPLTVGVSGRPGVGKSTVLAVLEDSPVPEEPPVEVHGVDDPDRPWPRLDHDVLVHVIVRALYPVDRRVLAGRDASGTVVVVNRIELVPDSVATVAELADMVGTPVVAFDAEPVQAAVAAAIARRRRVRDAALLGGLEAVAAAEPSVRSPVESFLAGAPAAAVRRAR